jgi:IS30 family transposase
MNGVLTKGGKRYFMTLIDDRTRFCYIYLIKSKDETLHYFKIYTAEVENQLERKIKHLWSDQGGEYFSNTLIHYVRNTTLFMRGHRLIHPNPMGLPREEPHAD